MNKKRKAIYEKSNGHCFYCGCKLGEKGWHADHFHPIIRINDYEIINHKLVGKDTGKRVHPDLDCDENLVPACAPCNLFKTTYSIDFLREEIVAQFERVRAKSSGFKMLERMGLITCHENEPVKFWFEKMGVVMPSKSELMGLHPDSESIEWKPDDDCIYCEINDRICTLRIVNNKWLCIATGKDWIQDRVEFDYCYEVDAKIKAADWCLRGFGNG